MSLTELYGHAALRQRLEESVEAGTLPASLLFHGPRGVGKQRLALWLAQRLLCTGGNPPCEKCTSCRYVRALTHPDLHWVFPRPRPRDADPDLQQVRDDYAEAIADRAAASGLYAPPSGSEGIYVATVRSLVQRASMAPAMGSRKIFIVGDAERMVPQEGADMAANAFLKLLEEPPADTTIVLTSSEPGALLPTIRSRVIAVRVPLVSDADVKAFLSDTAVKASFGKDRGGATDRVRAASGAPGRLFSGESDARATMAARKIIDAAVGDKRWQRYAPMRDLTHLDDEGRVRMVNVGNKPDSSRLAGAEGVITMTPETLEVIVRGSLKKGDVMAAARIAGIMAAKRTPELIPLCHPLVLNEVRVDIEPDRSIPGLRVTAWAEASGKTGVEMEALTAAAVALLTIYDMAKSVERGMEITGVRLVEKRGGKTGDWKRS